MEAGHENEVILRGTDEVGIALAALRFASQNPATTGANVLPGETSEVFTRLVEGLADKLVSGVHQASGGELTGRAQEDQGPTLESAIGFLATTPALAGMRIVLPNDNRTTTKLFEVVARFHPDESIQAALTRMLSEYNKSVAQEPNE